MYQALYRKYRPRTFSDVAGQEHVTTTLRRQIVTGRQSHAYLFVGTRGTGKTTCAKILSRAINCQNPIDGDPCNKCPPCIGIENGSILDVLELDAASNNGVDDVRALREEAIYTPATVNKRVYIIDEAHMLSNSAFNALLKILEEPPEHLVFILATTALHKIPATILGRCQRFSFKRLSPAAITSRLHFVAENEGFTLTEDAAKLLSTLADGSMRDALSLLDQCASEETVDLQRVLDTIGLASRQETLDLIKTISVRDTIAALSIFDSLYNDGRDMSSLFSEMASLVRDVLVSKLSPDSPLLSGGFSIDELSALSANFSHERLYYFLEVIRNAILSLSRGANAKTTVEMSLIRMCDERLNDDVSALSARIAKLESSAGGAAELSNSQFTIHNSQLPDESSNSSVISKFPDDNSQLPTPHSTLQTPNSQLLEEHDFPDNYSESQIPNSEFTKDTGFWDKILSHLKSEMSIYSLLSDKTKIRVEQQDNILLIHTGDLFTVSLIKSKKFLDPLTEAARKVLGLNTEIRVDVSEASAAESRVTKIDELGKFGIVEFE